MAIAESLEQSTSTATRQPPSDVAHALCGRGAWTPPRLFQRPRREDVVSRKGSSTKAAGHGVDASGSSFRRIELRLCRGAPPPFNLGSRLSYTAVSWYSRRPLRRQTPFRETRRGEVCSAAAWQSWRISSNNISMKTYSDGTSPSDGVSWYITLRCM